MPMDIIRQLFVGIQGLLLVKCVACCYSGKGYELNLLCLQFILHCLKDILLTFLFLVVLVSFSLYQCIQHQSFITCFCSVMLVSGFPVGGTSITVENCIHSQPIRILRIRNSWQVYVFRIFFTIFFFLLISFPKAWTKPVPEE